MGPIPGEDRAKSIASSASVTNAASIKMPVNRQDPFVDIRSPMCINSINNKHSEIPHALQAHRIASHRMAAQCNNDRTCVSPALYSTGCRSQLPGRLRRLFGSASEDAPWVFVAKSSRTSVRRTDRQHERASGRRTRVGCERVRVVLASNFCCWQSNLQNIGSLEKRRRPQTTTMCTGEATNERSSPGSRSQ